MVSISYYDRLSDKYISKDISFNEILEFGVVNYKDWNRNGSFKKWIKKAYVKIKEDKYETFDLDIIKELKVSLKGKYNTSKIEDIEYKNYSEKKAIDWKYVIEK